MQQPNPELTAVAQVHSEFIHHLQEIDFHLWCEESLYSKAEFKRLEDILASAMSKQHDWYQDFKKQINNVK